MGNYLTSVAAATAVLDYNLLRNQTEERSPVDRLLTGIALKGSAAAGDCEVEVKIDEVRVGSFFNTGTGFPNMDDLLPLEDLDVPAGAQIQAIVRDAAATNPINLMVALEDAE